MLTGPLQRFAFNVFSDCPKVLMGTRTLRKTIFVSVYVEGVEIRHIV